MSTRQKVCPLCGGDGRWDDIECLLCDTRGYIDIDDDDATALPPSSSGQDAVEGRPESAAPVVAGQADAPRSACPAPTENDVEVAYLCGYLKARAQRRDTRHAAGYALGAAHVAALHLEQRGRRAAVVAILVAFVVGVAAAPTLTALLAGALR